MSQLKLQFFYKNYLKTLCYGQYSNSRHQWTHRLGVPRLSVQVLCDQLEQHCTSTGKNLLILVNQNVFSLCREWEYKIRYLIWNCWISFKKFPHRINCFLWKLKKYLEILEKLSSRNIIIALLSHSPLLVHKVFPSVYHQLWKSHFGPYTCDLNYVVFIVVTWVK